MKINVPRALPIATMAAASILGRFVPAQAATTTVGPLDDTYLRDGTYANTNFGTDTTLYVKDDITSYYRRTYLKFPVPALSGSLRSAIVRLYGGNQGAGYSGTDIMEYLPSNSWSETTATYNNPPPPQVEDFIRTQTTITSTTQYYQWDMTLGLPHYSPFRNPTDPISLDLYMGNSATGLSADVFNSKEAASNKPQLVLTTSTDGANPVQLNMGADGNLYGVTRFGGANGGPALIGYGTLFKMTPAGVTTILHSFNLTDGAYPSSRIIEGTAGNFYGVTLNGGANSLGTIYKITSAGAFTLLHSATAAEGTPALSGPQGEPYTNFGINPPCNGDYYGNFGHTYAGLVAAGDGNLYGVTTNGGASGKGIVFKVTPAGVFSTVHTFSGPDGSHPEILILGADGNLYGAGSFGESGNDAGMIFKITTAGTYTLLHSFTASDGAFAGGLFQASDNNLYGGVGASIYRITPAGVYTVLHQLASSEGRWLSGLSQGADGNLYGVSSQTGSGTALSTLYRISLAGVFTLLHGFSPTEGPASAPPLKAGDGNLYGFNLNSAYKITNGTGAFSFIHTFSGNDGTIATNILDGHDGLIYGTTAVGGGGTGWGVAFRLESSGTITPLHSF